MSRNKEHSPNGVAAEGGVSMFFVSANLFFYIMNICGYSLYIPYIYICVLNIFHLFSLVCFLVHGVSRRKT